MADLLRQFEQDQIANADRPRLRAGDEVRVNTKVTEGGKTRVQPFEGTVIAVRGSGPSKTFTVRRETDKYGVERIFPLYSPVITDIEILKRQKVRRSKLAYLRKAGRRRVKEDVEALQQHAREEEEKKRLAEEAKRKEAEEQKKAEEEAQKQAEAEEQAKAAEDSSDADASENPSDEETSTEATEESTEKASEENTEKEG